MFPLPPIPTSNRLLSNDSLCRFLTLNMAIAVKEQQFIDSVVIFIKNKKIVVLQDHHLLPTWTLTLFSSLASLYCGCLGLLDPLKTLHSKQTYNMSTSFTKASFYATVISIHIVMEILSMNLWPWLTRSLGEYNTSSSQWELICIMMNACGCCNVHWQTESLWVDPQ